MLSMPANLDLTHRVLIPVIAPPSSSPKSPRVGHYRLARVPRIEAGAVSAPDRFEHLRRSYD